MTSAGLQFLFAAEDISTARPTEPFGFVVRVIRLGSGPEGGRSGSANCACAVERLLYEPLFDT